MNGADLNPAQLGAHDGAIGRWENEGGDTAGLHPHGRGSVVGEIGDVEDGNLRVRLIALENIVVALLAGAPDGQFTLVREMADYISPRPGMTPHRLTIEAARNMIALAERAARYKALEDEQGHEAAKSHIAQRPNTVAMMMPPPSASSVNTVIASI